MCGEFLKAEFQHSFLLASVCDICYFIKLSSSINLHQRYGWKCVTFWLSGYRSQRGRMSHTERDFSSTQPRRMSELDNRTNLRFKGLSGDLQLRTSRPLCTSPINDLGGNNDGRSMTAAKHWSDGATLKQLTVFFEKVLKRVCRDRIYFDLTTKTETYVDLRSIVWGPS